MFILSYQLKKDYLKKVHLCRFENEPISLSSYENNESQFMLANLKKTGAESSRSPTKFQVNIKIQLHATHASRLSLRFLCLWFFKDTVELI